MCVNFTKPWTISQVSQHVHRIYPDTCQRPGSQSAIPAPSVGFARNPWLVPDSGTRDRFAGLTENHSVLSPWLR
jgi:hypothetical protein